MEQQSDFTEEALRLLVERCPRLVRMCYWAGTSSISIEDLGHRQSFDLDFHTRKALEDVRPILAEIQKAFPGKFEIVQAPDEFGAAFRGVLTLPRGDRITVEVLSNYEDVAEQDLVDCVVAPGIKRVSLSRYLADKIQCVAERMEARDLVDILAIIRSHPAMSVSAKRLLAQQDALLLAERLLAWTDEAIEKDLNTYTDVNPGDAKETRDLLLGWLKSGDQAQEE